MSEIKTNKPVERERGEQWCCGGACAISSPEDDCVRVDEGRIVCPCGPCGASGWPGETEDNADCETFYSYSGQCAQGGDGRCGPR